MRQQGPHLALVVAAMLAASLAAGAALAQDESVPTRRAALGGYTVTAPDGATPAEELLLDPDLVPALLAIPVEGSIRLSDWPLEPGVRRDVLLTRHEVYAVDARLFVIEEEGEIEVPRSNLHFLWGEVEDGDPSPVMVSVDPGNGAVHGHAQGSEGWVELRPAGAGRQEYIVAPSIAFAEPGTGPLGFECGQSTLPTIEPQLWNRSALDQNAATLGTLHKATLAVDTDNELMLLKFVDSTTSATNYIASLFALMTAAYERDLQVRLLQGTTFLRVSSTPDPYLQSGTGSADIDKLTEFQAYWSSHYGAIPRAAAMMLSGKQLEPNKASGIAYVDVLCNEQFGYSFTQVFKFSGSNAASDLRIVSHENGHNFGSLHTHCYLDPTPIDKCNNTQGGCYSGATSCPTSMTINGVPDVTGTVMSYCHQVSDCSSKTVFHPRTVEILSPIVQSKVGDCVFVLANPKEASPAEDLRAGRGGGSLVTVAYTPACGATDHTVYGGNLATLHTGGISWSQRHCLLGTSGSLVFNPGTGSVYFVVVANNGSREGSYGQGTAGERPPAGPGPGCQYTQDLSGPCP